MAENCSHQSGHSRQTDGLVLSSIAAVFTLALAFLVLCGCVSQKPLKGGSTVTVDPNGGTTTLEQGENPQQPTTQITEEEIQRDFGIMAGQEENKKWLPSDFERASEAKRQQVREYIKRKTQTSLGAAQKDTSREFAAKFANMKPVQWVGIACILGAGAFIYFQWWTPAIIAGATGIGLIALAHSIVGNERLILVLLIAAAAILAVFRAYEKGQLDFHLGNKKTGGEKVKGSPEVSAQDYNQ
jgi:hypothetical protein